MNLELLYEIRSIVNETPDDKLNMDTIWCGSVGCALGHAAHNPKFQDLGLGTTTIGSTWPSTVLTLHGHNVPYDTAASAVFEISHRDAQYLFGPIDDEIDYDEGPPHVCHKQVFNERFEAFINGVHNEES